MIRLCNFTQFWRIWVISVTFFQFLFGHIFCSFFFGTLLANLLSFLQFLICGSSSKGGSRLSAYTGLAQPHQPLCPSPRHVHMAPCTLQTSSIQTWTIEGGQVLTHQQQNHMVCRTFYWLSIECRQQVKRRHLRAHAVSTNITLGEERAWTLLGLINTSCMHD